jgi:hypothetical protein
MNDPADLGGGMARTLTVRVPLALPRRGGRKLAVIPEGAPVWAPRRARVDNAMVKALARAHRWKRILESGEFATMEDLAAPEKINPSYLGRVLRLTLLAPDIVEGSSMVGSRLDCSWRHCSSRFRWSGASSVDTVGSNTRPTPRKTSLGFTSRLDALLKPHNSLQIWPESSAGPGRDQARRLAN